MMTAFRRLSIIALLAALAAQPAMLRAQDTANEAAPAESVGPAALEDFNLQGTVTRPAGEAPVTQRPAQTPTPRPSPPQPTATAPAASAPQQAETSRAPAPAATPAPPRPETARVAERVPADTGVVASPEPAPAPTPSRPATPADTGGIGWPWVVLAGLIVAGAAAFAWSRRGQFAEAGYGRGDALSYAVPEPQPEPSPPARPVPAPPPPPVATPRPTPVAPVHDEIGTVVSKRMRPMVELAFRPLSCSVDDENFTLDFEIGLFNGGNQPARAVLVEARYFNAGPTQDEEIQTFFANPVGEGGRAPAIAAGKRMVVRNRIVTPRSAIREYEVDGRKFFVPLFAFNTLYEWGSSGHGQTSAGYLLGVRTSGEKMAPMRLDTGARDYRSLGRQALPMAMQV